MTIEKLRIEWKAWQAENPAPYKRIADDFVELTMSHGWAFAGRWVARRIADRLEVPYIEVRKLLARSA